MLDNADLIAPEGFLYTDGRDVYAKKIWLGEGMDADSFKLVSEEEYQRLTETEDTYADSL